jgi:hypothetical protein
MRIFNFDDFFFKYVLNVLLLNTNKISWFNKDFVAMTHINYSKKF